VEDVVNHSRYLVSVDNVNVNKDCIMMLLSCVSPFAIIKCNKPSDIYIIGIPYHCILKHFTKHWENQYHPIVIIKYPLFTNTFLTWTIITMITVYEFAVHKSNLLYHLIPPIKNLCTHILIYDIFQSLLYMYLLNKPLSLPRKIIIAFILVFP